MPTDLVEKTEMDVQTDAVQIVERDMQTIAAPMKDVQTDVVPIAEKDVQTIAAPMKDVQTDAVPMTDMAVQTIAESIVGTPIVVNNIVVKRISQVVERKVEVPGPTVEKIVRVPGPVVQMPCRCLSESVRVGGGYHIVNLVKNSDKTGGSSQDSDEPQNFCLASS